MTDTETLTAALRRLADEHASGLLAVATPGRDVVLELADGVPVGIGPTHDVSDRVGRDASAELVAAAVVDGLVDRTVAAIVGGGGDWIWDVDDPAAMMPVPPDLATELSRRAVDAAQALATLATDQVLEPGRDLETHGEVDRIRRLFDGERTVEEVAEVAGLTAPAVATLAAALVAAGVLSTGQQDAGPVSWTDAVAGSSAGDEDDDDEPELWVMDPPEDDEDGQDDEEAAEAAPAGEPSPAGPAARTEERPEPVEERPEPVEEPAAEPTEPHEDPAAEPTAPHEEPAAATGPVASTAGTADAAAPGHDDDWSDTTWLDDLDGSEGHSEPTTGPADREDADEPGDARAALSAMINDLQGPGKGAPPAPTPAPSQGDESGPDAEPDDAEASEQRVSSDARRKEPKAAPGEVAEFLRELSRLALDDE